MLKLGCEKCKSDDIYENNIVHVRLRVNGWQDDGEPDDFGNREDVNETIRTVEPEEAPRWYCGSCGDESEFLTNLETGERFEG